MKKYLAVKYYGHYINAYIIEADSEKDAYTNAVYGEQMFSVVFDKFYGEGGLAKEIGSDTTLETQFRWLIEAIEMGMPGTKEQNELVTGLPFTTSAETKTVLF